MIRHLLFKISLLQVYKLDIINGTQYIQMSVTDAKYIYIYIYIYICACIDECMGAQPSFTNVTEEEQSSG